MRDKQIPMAPAEIVPVTPPKQEEQDFYGTAAPKKPKKKHTGLIVALCMSCALVATVVAAIGLMHRHPTFIGSLLIKGSQILSQHQEETKDKELQPNTQASTQTPSGIDSDKQLQLNGQPAAAQELTAQELYAAVSPSIVCVHTSSSAGSSTGTGIILDKNGFILTDKQTVSGARQINIIFSNDETETAQLIGIDNTTGFALLYCQTQLPSCASFAQAQTVTVGDKLYCIGNPYGTQVRNVLSEGILSACSSVEINGEALTVLHTTASFGTGINACPIIDSTGSIVAVSSPIGETLTETGEDPGFAVSAADVQKIAQRIIAQANNAENRWLGFEVEQIPLPYYYYYRFPGTLWIRSVGTDSYADGALSVYDVVLSVNGVSVSTAEEYTAALAGYAIGDLIELRIYRGGIYYKITLPLTAK